jgi:hypothetical protein
MSEYVEKIVSISLMIFGAFGAAALWLAGLAIVMRLIDRIEQ